MTAVDTLRKQIRIALDTGTYVVLTAEEAQSVLNELDALVHDVERLTATNAELATDAENLRGVVRAADAMYASADHTGGNPGCYRCDAADDFLAARAKVKP